jgi:hypothetical protein
MLSGQALIASTSSLLPHNAGTTHSLAVGQAILVRSTNREGGRKAADGRIKAAASSSDKRMVEAAMVVFKDS